LRVMGIMIKSVASPWSLSLHLLPTFQCTGFLCW
jgi:hypothetical protein